MSVQLLAKDEYLIGNPSYESFQMGWREGRLEQRPQRLPFLPVAVENAPFSSQSTQILEYLLMPRLRWSNSYLSGDTRISNNDHWLCDRPGVQVEDHILAGAKVLEAEYRCHLVVSL